MIRTVIVLEEAAEDIEIAIDFYEAAEQGAGAYFRDSLVSDIRRLAHYVGVHSVHHGFHRALASRFPFAIYYRDDGTTRKVVAVLDLRQHPSRGASTLAERSSDNG